MPEFIRRGSDVTIIQHSAKDGKWPMPARIYEMLPPRPFPEFKVVVILRHKPPRSPLWRYTYIVPGGYVYYTIEKDEQKIYDSRSEVPCNMEMFTQLADLTERSGFSQTPPCDHAPLVDDWDFAEAIMLFDEQRPTGGSRRRKRSRARPAEVIQLADIRTKRSD